LLRAENRFNDGLTLRSQAQVFLREEIYEAPLGALGFGICHDCSIPVGGSVRQRRQRALARNGNISIMSTSNVARFLRPHPSPLLGVRRTVTFEYSKLFRGSGKCAINRVQRRISR